MLPSADEDNDDAIESFWLYIFSVFPSFVYYYLYIIIYNNIERKLFAEVFYRIYVATIGNLF